MDDITSNINFLYDLKTEQGKDKSKRTKLEWDDIEYTRATLIDHVEKNNLEAELITRVWDKWHEIEEFIASKRKKRFRKVGLQRMS